MALLLFACFLFLSHASPISAQPLKIYWAVPSQPCLNRTRPPLDPTIFGIRTNKGHKFHGSEIVIFYESQLGLYPYIDVGDGGDGRRDSAEEQQWQNEQWDGGNSSRDANRVKFVNGGIPQNADVRAHLEKAEADILAAIPDPDFSGPAVIDYEKWRPEWSLNWASRRIYQFESTRDALARFPGISEKAAVELGREMFNKRARKFMVHTIRLGRRLRPKALWGFYDTPLCNYDAGEQWPSGCLDQFKKHNEKLWWLYAEVGALYSSIYLHPGDRKRQKGICERHMQAKMAEAEWIWSLRRRDRPIVLFSKIELDPYSTHGDTFYSAEELFCSYEWTAQLGADALVVWSSSSGIRQRCQPIANYLHGTFGPFVRQLLNNAEDCFLRICNGRGGCVLRNRRRHHRPWRGTSNEPLWPRKHFTCLCPQQKNLYGEYCDLEVGEGRQETGQS